MSIVKEKRSQDGTGISLACWTGLKEKKCWRAGKEEGWEWKYGNGNGSKSNPVREGNGIG